VQSSRLATALLAAAVASALGCASPVPSYPGSRLPAHAVATLKGDGHVRVLEIDGRPLDGREFEILPGGRLVLFRLVIRGEELHERARGHRRHLICELSFTAVAGHAYRLTRTRPHFEGRSDTVAETRTVHRFETFLVDLTAERQVEEVSGSCRRP